MGWRGVRRGMPRFRGCNHVQSSKYSMYQCAFYHKRNINVHSLQVLLFDNLKILIEIPPLSE